MLHAELTENIIGCAMTVHHALGPGFVESVYQNALAHELRKAALVVEIEKPIRFTYDGIVVGAFKADLIVAEVVLIEVKAVIALNAAYEVQTVNYLTATGIEIGLLINFGGPRLEFKRKHRHYAPRPQPPTETGSTPEPQEQQKYGERPPIKQQDRQENK